jgi:hypothetical protein
MTPKQKEALRYHLNIIKLQREIQDFQKQNGKASPLQLNNNKRILTLKDQINLKNKLSEQMRSLELFEK